MSRSRLSHASNQEGRAANTSSSSSHLACLFPSSRLSWRSQSQPPFGDLSHSGGTPFGNHSPVFLNTESAQQINSTGTEMVSHSGTHTSNSRTLSYPTRLRNSVIGAGRISSRPRASTSRRALRSLRFQTNPDTCCSSSSSNTSLSGRCRTISEAAGAESAGEATESEVTSPHLLRFASLRVVASGDMEPSLAQSVPLAMQEGSCDLDEFANLPVRTNTVDQAVPNLNSSGVVVPNLRHLRSRPVSEGAMTDLPIVNFSTPISVEAVTTGDCPSELHISESSLSSEDFLHPTSTEHQVVEVYNVKRAASPVVRFPLRDLRAQASDGVPSRSRQEPESDHIYYRSTGSNGPYRCPEQLQKVLTGVNDLRQKGLFCDVILQVGSKSIPAHRNVLAASSRYFRAMLTGAMAEARSACIKIMDVDEDALCQLVDFMYTGEIQVSEDTVQALLPAANLFQVTSVREACCDFLQSQLHPSNCLGIQRFADLHNCFDLLAASRRYAEQHFGELLDQSEEFLALTSDQLSQLLASDHLAVSEDRVFEAVLRWIAFDVEQRQQFAPSLCSRVRFSLLPRDYLVRLSQSDTFLAVNPWCKDYLIEALSYHLLSWEEKLQVDSQSAKPRTPRGLPKILLMIGGQSPKALRSIEIFDFRTGRWINDKTDAVTPGLSTEDTENSPTEATDRHRSPSPRTVISPMDGVPPCIPELPSRRCRFGVAVVNGLVYVVGGFNGALRVRTVEIFDPLRNEWHSGPNMECRRATLGVAVLDGQIYAIGGFDGNSGLNSSEVLDLWSNTWRFIAPMSCRRSSVGAATLCGKIYAVGGYDGNTRRCLHSAEYYDPKTNDWTRIANMTCRRSGCAVAVLNNRLYAIGGHDGPVVRNTVEMYSPDTASWQRVGDMNVRRRNACAIVHDGCLYVVGGEEATVNISSIEKYDPATNTWTLLPESMRLGRSYAGIAIVDRHTLM